MKNTITHLFYQVSELLKTFALSSGIFPKRGRKSKVSDWEIATVFIVCYHSSLEVFPDERG